MINSHKDLYSKMKEKINFLLALWLLMVLLVHIFFAAELKWNFIQDLTFLMYIYRVGLYSFGLQNMEVV